MKIETRLTILGDNQEISIELRDHRAGVTFLSMTLSPQDFCLAAFGRRALVHCEAEILHVGKLGKIQKIEEFTFRMPENVDWKEKKNVAKRLAAELCPEGWTPDLNFSSQGSFFLKKKNKKSEEWGKTVIRKWVDAETSESEAAEKKT